MEIVTTGGDNEEKTLFKYEDHSFSQQEIYRLLGFSTRPTERELKAKVIIFMNKYKYNTEPDDLRLNDFFDKLYDHLFLKDTFSETTEGFVTQSTPFSQQKSVVTPPLDNRVIKTSGDENKEKDERSVVQTVNPVSYSKDVLNPILKQTIQRVISIDSRYRNINNNSNKTNTISTNFTIELSEPLRDVLSLKLYSYQIPFTWYTVNKDFGSNFFIIKGNTLGFTDEYKVEILPGNYSATTLSNAIQNAIQLISNNNKDVSFGNTNIYYNPITTVATFTIDIKKSYQEPQFFLDWVISTPLYNKDRDSSNNNTSSISEYLGFNNQTYGLNTVYSARNVLPSIDTSNRDDNYAYIYKIKNGINDYFTYILYDPGFNNDGHVNLYSTSQTSKNIDISLNLQSGLYSRSQLVTQVNLIISQNANFVSGASHLTRYNQDNNINSYFGLSLVIDKKNTNLNENYKSIIKFPNEPSIDFQTGNYPIWTGTNSCFGFDSSYNELNNIVAEYPLFQSNYVITNPKIQFTVNSTAYSRTFSVVVSSSPATGYTYSGYSDAINNAFKNVTNADDIFVDGILSYGENQFYYDENSIPTFNFNLNYIITANQYQYIYFFNNISINSTYLKFVQINGSSATIEGNYIRFDISGNESLQFKLENPIPIESSYTLSGINTTADKFLKITPRTKANSTEIDISLINTNFQIGLTFSNFDIFINYILYLITNYNSSGNASNPLKFSTIQKGIVTVNGVSKYQLYLNIDINKIITANDCTVELIDDDTHSWVNNLYFSEPSYNLSTSTIIKGSQSIKATSVLTLSDSSNKYFNFIPQPYASGLSSNYNSIKISISPGTYSVNSLYDALNTAFYNNEITRGSYFYTITKNSRSYCVLRININKTFYPKDYALDFYDLTSFVKCYVGSSVRNTTWDSTIGWILGFHEKTVYELSAYSSDNSSIQISGELSVNTNLYSYFLISVDDFNQNRLNDGLVTITRPEQQMSLPSYFANADITTDFSGNIGTSGSSIVAENNLTAKQVYSINQILESRKNTSKIYSQGPYVKDIFGFIPLKLPSTPGDLITEYGGTLQNQDRLYFGPVNIRRLQVQLINDKGTIMDLNGSDWSFSFICEQLYQKKIT